MIFLGEENTLQQVLAVPGPVPGPSHGPDPLPYTWAVRNWIDLLVARFVDATLQRVTPDGDLWWWADINLLVSIPFQKH